MEDSRGTTTPAVTEGATAAAAANDAAVLRWVAGVGWRRRIGPEVWTRFVREFAEARLARVGGSSNNRAAELTVEGCVEALEANL